MFVFRLIIMSLKWALSIAELAIVVRAILSWIPSMESNRFTRIVHQITEPILAPIRSLVEKSSIGREIMIDISPIIAVLLIEIISRIL